MTYLLLGPKKVIFGDFSDFCDAKFFTHFYIFAPKKAQKINFFSFKTREKLFWRQKICGFFICTYFNGMRRDQV